MAERAFLVGPAHVVRLSMAGLLRISLVLVGAFALAVSWLDEQAFAAAWLGMILLFSAVAGLSCRQAFAAGFFFGWLYFIVALHWAPNMLAITLASEDQLSTPWIAFLVIAAWQAIPFAVVSAAVASRNQLAIPAWACACGWIVMERLWPNVFPWSLAHTQIGYLPMVQVAELGGVYLVSFVFIYACIEIGLHINRGEFVPRLPTIVPLLLVVANICFGLWRLGSLATAQEDQNTIRAGVVQIDPSFVDSTKKMRAASDQLPPVDLLLWPESTLGSYSAAVGRLDDLREDIRIAHLPFLDWKPARGLSAWLLAGGKTFQPGAGNKGPYYQTAYLIDTKGVFRDRYHKRVLMPIGEYMPLERWYPWLHDWARLTKKAAWGTSDSPLITKGGVRIGVLLCYEDIVPEVSRRSVAEGAQLLVSLINASAFEDAIALEQHLRLARLRSVENRRTLIRCAGTGISCCIAPTGKIVERLPTNSEGSFAVEAQLDGDRTIYNRFGYLFPHVAAGALGILTLSLMATQRRMARADNRSPAGSGTATEFATNEPAP